MNSIQTSVNDLLSRQPKEWKLFKDNLDALNGVQTKRYQIGQFEIVAQFNPARVVSTAAKVDKASIQKRKCFLCPEHLPAEQLRLPVLDGYQILQSLSDFPQSSDDSNSSTHAAKHITTHPSLIGVVKCITSLYIIL